MKETVLIIDDNSEILDFISDILNEKYKTIVALDAEMGLRLLDNNVVHLIISDVMMPGIDGFELCRNLKSNLSYCHIPIILLTAKTTYRAKIEGLEKGADAYIKKPFSPELLQVQIANLLNNRSKIKDHAAHSPFEDMNIHAISKSEEQFLKTIEQYIKDNIANRSLDIGQLAEYMNMSRPTFYRKIKLLSSVSPKELINQTRLKKAVDLMARNDYKIYQIAEIAGYSSQSVFGKSFQKYFKQSPLEYIASLKKKL